MKMPSISVLFPVYNCKTSYLREAIESILEQTFEDFELIILDDGSENDVASVIEEYAKRAKERGKFFNKEKTVKAVEVMFENL